jgi:Zn ribbon nucleic-acid-binding protein
MKFYGNAYVDRGMIDKIIVRNKLQKIDLSNHIYGGDCPFCGRAKSFCLWEEKGTFRCYWCGCDGRFVRTPERELEERNLLKAKLAASEEV